MRRRPPGRWRTLASPGFIAKQMLLMLAQPLDKLVYACSTRHAASCGPSADRGSTSNMPKD